jgi:hypothetical protein
VRVYAHVAAEIGQRSPFRPDPVITDDVVEQGPVVRERFVRSICGFRLHEYADQSRAVLRASTPANSKVPVVTVARQRRRRLPLDRYRACSLLRRSAHPAQAAETTPSLVWRCLPSDPVRSDASCRSDVVRVNDDLRDHGVRTDRRHHVCRCICYARGPRSPPRTSSDVGWPSSGRLAALVFQSSWLRSNGWPDRQPKSV